MHIYSNRAQKHITLKYKIDVLSKVRSTHTNHNPFPMCSAAELAHWTWLQENWISYIFMAFKCEK